MGLGTSVMLTVRVVEIQKEFFGKALVYSQSDRYPNETQTDTLTPKAAKALKKAKPGDLVGIVINYSQSNIIKAKRITGTLEYRVAALEAAMKAAGFEFPAEEKI